MYRIISYLIVVLAINLTTTAYAAENFLSPGDDGWLKAMHYSCKEDYGFDDEIYKNCYELAKSQHVYVLGKVVLESENMHDLVKRIEKSCEVYTPIWTKVLDCSKSILKKEAELRNEPNA